MVLASFLPRLLCLVLAMTMNGLVTSLATASYERSAGLLSRDLGYRRAEQGDPPGVAMHPAVP